MRECNRLWAQSGDEYDDAEAEVAAVQRAHSLWPSSAEKDGGNEGIEVAALTGSSRGDSTDSGLGWSPHGRFNERQDIDEPSHRKRKFSLSEDEPADDGNQFDLSERGSTEPEAPTAKLRLIVRLASDDRNEHSDVIANLVFKLPADMHDEIMSEVILEVMPEAE
ncbi:hypothetical protein QAD02_003106 [Eretmocerus hayati]|uniref:Uncharacterized protein n=1 Tax=Eretmocerus hayati TaxID=131215 RepID=A0ACC2NNN4_9HYME|nr:hypothetical protein QAD02_003106 [Eretmocerus hayati]